MFNAIFTTISYLLLILAVAPLFPFLYVVLRWRVGGHSETGVGTYGALLYFCTVSVLLGVAGAANLTYGAISTTPIEEELNRLSWGMFTAAAAFLVLNAVLARRSDPGAFGADARRVFGGFLMVMAGMVSLTVLVLLGMALFEKVPDLDEHADRIKLYAVWSAFFLALYLLAARSLGLSNRR